MNSRISGILVISVVLAVLAFASIGALAQETAPSSFVESISDERVKQGDNITIAVRGQGLIQRDVTIDPADGMHIEVLDVQDDRIKVNIRMDCDADVGKRRLSIGGITSDANDRPLYFYGDAFDCKAAEIAALNKEPDVGINGFGPPSIEQGTTQQGYVLGKGLLQIAKFTVVGSGVTMSILPGGNDEKIPVEFKADAKTFLGGRGIIAVLKNGTELRSTMNAQEVLRIQVIEPRLKVAAEDEKPVPTLRDEPSDDELLDTAVTDVEKMAGEQPPQAACEGLVLLVDGHEIGETTTVEGGSLKFTIKRGAYIAVRTVRVEAESRALKRAMNVRLHELAEPSKTVCSERTREFRVPSQFPGGEYDITLHVEYTDESLRVKKITKRTKLIVPGGSGFMGMLSDAAKEKLLGDDIVKVKRELDYDDYTAEDLERLGISIEDYRKGLALWRAGDKEGAKKLLGELRRTTQERRKITWDTMKETDEDTIKKVRDAMEGGVEMDPEVETQVFEVVRGDERVVKSRITIIVPAEDAPMGEQEIVVVIPKELAASLDGITFSDPDYIIVEADPVVKWAFGHTAEGAQREVSVTVDGDAKEAPIVARAAGDTQSAWTGFLLWLAKLFGAGA